MGPIGISSSSRFDGPLNYADPVGQGHIKDGQKMLYFIFIYIQSHHAVDNISSFKDP